MPSKEGQRGTESLRKRGKNKNSIHRGSLLKGESRERRREETKVDEDASKTGRNEWERLKKLN